MKSIMLSLSTLSLLNAGLFAQVAPGDIAFTLYDALSSGTAGDPDFEGDDQFAFVALNSIAAGETISFRDADLNPDFQFDDDAEDEILWTATEDVPAGTVVAFTTNNELAVNVGEVVAVDGPGLRLTNQGDNIYAFIGADNNAPTTFIAAISTTDFGDAVIGNDGVIPGTGLVVGSAFAILLDSGTVGGQYSNVRAGQAALPDYADFIEDVPNNWLQSSQFDSNLIADTTAFVVGGVPLELTITVTVASFSESAGAAASEGTVSILGALDTDLVVALSSSDTTEASIPSSVTIPAGELDSAPFDIDAVDDLQADGDRVVTLLATSAGFIQGESTLTVTDDGDNPTTVLATGDILFSCFNGNSNSFAFVAINEIPGGEVIYFTDEEWDDSIDAFGSGERDIIWTAPADGVGAGTVIGVTNVNDPSVNVGSLTTTGSTGLNANSETIYAYQGPVARVPVTFLATVGNTVEDSILNTGLTRGVDSFLLDESFDYGDYASARFGLDSIAEYAPLLADIANNWVQADDAGNADTLCNATAFIIGTPPSITIVDCGFVGDDFFIDVAEGAAGLRVTSSEALDFASGSVLNAVVDATNPNRLIIPAAEIASPRDFFRLETQ